MFGLFLKRFRMIHHIKQIELAKVLGVTSVYVCRIEKGVLQASDGFYQKFIEHYQNIFTDEEKADLDFVEVQKPITMKNEFLDNFCTTRGVNNAILSRALSYSQTYIGAMRNGKIGISPVFARKFFDAYGPLLTEEEKEQLIATVNGRKQGVSNLEVNKPLFFAEWMADFRMSRGISQMELAKEVDTSYTNVSNIERGLSNASFSFLDRFLDAYGNDLTLVEKEQLFMHFEKQYPKYVEKIIFKFIRKNNLMPNLLEIKSLLLEEEDLKKLFDETVEKGKELSIKREKSR